ncbi:unnamed protein product, partial [Phaeothamnion confervicola]
RSYSFDLCAHEGFSQEDMFRSCGLIPLLDAAVDGYACTAFCFGPTGTGKTYTMSGLSETAAGTAKRRRAERHAATAAASGNGSASSTSGLDPSDGLVRRSVHHLFERIRSDTDATYKLRASYSEIYNEHVYDLLNLQKESLQVRYNVKTGFFVQGLLEASISSLEDLLAIVDEGDANRHRAGHLLNADSSRSHSLLTVSITAERADPEDGHVVRRCGKVVFVDLAGSERIKKTGVNTVGANEAGMINKSLMTLGKVISALSTLQIRAAAAAGGGGGGGAGGATSPTAAATAVGSGFLGGSTHGAGGGSGGGSGGGGGNGGGGGGGNGGKGEDTWVPYRDSNLTKLLMESLGGHGLTLMIACVAPTQAYAEETAAALNYAARARNIQNKPILQVDPREKLIANLRREVHLLRMENEVLRSSLASRGSAHPPSDTAGGDVGALVARSGGGSGVEGDSAGISPGSPGGKRNATGAGDGNGGSEADGGAQQQPRVPREVAQLLARYEEEVNRLRREAASAVQDSQAAERQYKEAIGENEALGRRLERLEQASG